MPELDDGNLETAQKTKAAEALQKDNEAAKEANTNENAENTPAAKTDNDKADTLRHYSARSSSSEDEAKAYVQEVQRQKDPLSSVVGSFGTSQKTKDTTKASKRPHDARASISKDEANNYVQEVRRQKGPPSSVIGSQEKNAKSRAKEPGSGSFDTPCRSASYTPHFHLSKGRPKSVFNEIFPMEMGQFQQRMFFMVSGLQKDMKEQHKILTEIRLLTYRNEDGAAEENNFQAKTVSELKELERRLKSNKDMRKDLRKKLTITGLSAEDMKKHMRSALKVLMTTKVEVKVNLSKGNNVHGKKYKYHVSLKKNLPNIFNILLAVLTKRWDVDEKMICHCLSEWLKQAPKRFEREQAFQIDDEHDDEKEDTENESGSQPEMDMDEDDN